MVLADQKQSAILVDSATNKGKLSYTLKTMAAAGTAASFAELLTIPIDTSKVRLQVQGENVNTKGLPSQLKYRGMIHTIATIAKEEEAQSLFKGLTAGVHRQLCFCGIRIGLYDTVRKMYGDSTTGKPKVMVKVLASCTTASAAVMMFQPTEVVKIRFQVSGAKQRYSSAYNAYTTIGRVEGVKGLWRGWSTNVLRLSVVNCTEIVVYDVIKSYVLYRNWMQDKTPLHLISALYAGFITVTIASPIDVVKTRYMNSTTGSYTSPIHCAMQMLKQNGPSAFYKGFIPAFTRLGSWSVAFFVTYEQFKKMI